MSLKTSYTDTADVTPIGKAPTKITEAKIADLIHKHVGWYRHTGVGAGIYLKGIDVAARAIYQAIQKKMA